MIPGSGRSAGEEIGYPLQNLGFPSGSAGKESAFNAGDLGSIPGLERSAGEGKGYPLQYSGLENSMDCVGHGIAKSRTRLSDFRITCYTKVYYQVTFLGFTALKLLMTCFLLGHAIFLSSPAMSLKKRFTLEKRDGFFAVFSLATVNTSSFPYFVSLWSVCLRQNLQYFFISSLSGSFFLFFSVS